MFTGLIEEVGELGSVRIAPAGLRLGVLCPRLAPALSVGESIAVDGVCLTVTSRGRDAFEAEAVGDTLEKTTLQGMRRGRRVNLERSLAAGGRLDGHIVMGHVTGRARIRSWGPASSSAAKSGADDLAAWFLIIDLDPSWADRIAVEGSIAVDGISLTVAGLEGIESLTGPPESVRFGARISVIPHTRLATGLASKKIGDEVNVELDVLASYVRTAVAALFRSGSVNETSALGSPRLDIERLKSWGYR